MIFILGWATVLIFVIICFLSGLPDYIRNLDEEIKEKHRTPVKPRLQPAPKNKAKLKRVK